MLNIASKISCYSVMPVVLAALAGAVSCPFLATPVNAQTPTAKRVLTHRHHDHHVRRYICPIDGGQTSPVGHDGKPSLRRYSDLEQPTRAYTNQVLACPKCGYAAWKGAFEKPPSGAVVHHVRSHFKRSAKRAATDPVIAYQHHLNLLHLRKVSIREQIGAALFFSYVLKRKRPYGGMDPKLERKLIAARTRTLKLLQSAMKGEPPRRLRTRLEWRYLIGEMLRLTGKPRAAQKPLQAVCEAKRKAGHTTGRLACEMAHRAAAGETWEDYRDGVFDVRSIDIVERRIKQDILRRKAEEIARKKAADAAAEAHKKAAEHKRRKSEKAKSPVDAGKGATARGHLEPQHGEDPLAPAAPPPAK